MTDKQMNILDEQRESKVDEVLNRLEAGDLILVMAEVDCGKLDRQVFEEALQRYDNRWSRWLTGVLARVFLGRWPV